MLEKRCKMEENTYGNSKEAIELFKLVQEDKHIQRLVGRHLDECVKGFVYLLKIPDDAKSNSTGNGRRMRRHLMHVWREYYKSYPDQKDWPEKIRELFKKIVIQRYKTYNEKENNLSQLEVHQKLIDRCYKKTTTEQAGIVDKMIEVFKGYLREDAHNFRRSQKTRSLKRSLKIFCNYGTINDRWDRIIKARSE